MNISGVLGGALLTAGISHTVNKLDQARNKVRSAQDIEGMNHNSIATTVRRLASTQFGSAWLGFTKAFMKNMAGTFFAKGLGPGSSHAKDMLSSFNKTGRVAMGKEQGSVLRSIGSGIHSGLSALVYDTPLRNFAPARGFVDFTERWLKPEVMKESLGLTGTAAKKSAKAAAEQASVGSQIGDSINRIKQIRAADLRPGALFERGSNLVRNNSIARYAAMGAGAAIGINMLAGTYRGEVKYDKEQEQGHIDIYTKEAFAKGTHMSKAAQRSIAAANKLGDQGIDNKNTSVIREIQRFSLTDFGSRHEPFSPTSTIVNQFFLENQALERGHFNRVDNQKDANETYNHSYEKRVRDNMQVGMQSAQETIQRAHLASQAVSYAEFMNQYKEELAIANQNSDSSIFNESLTGHVTPNRFF